MRKGASTLQAGNACSHGLGRGAGSPLGTDLFSFRQPRQGGVLVGSSELHTPDGNLLHVTLSLLPQRTGRIFHS